MSTVGEAGGDDKKKKKKKEPRVRPPQELLSRLVEEFSNVRIDGGGKNHGEVGILNLTSELSEAVIEAITDAYSRGVNVGATAKATEGAQATTSVTQSAGAEIQASGEVSMRPSSSVTGTRKRSLSVTKKMFAEGAVTADIEARKQNGIAAAQIAGELQGTDTNVTLTTGPNVGKQVEVTVGHGFINKGVGHVMDKAYRRGMAAGRAATSGAPAVTDQTVTREN